jgi:hypothetical protein
MRYDGIPDVRDGLTREERVVLYVLDQTQKERGGRNVPTPMLWGRVCEYFYISVDRNFKRPVRSKSAPHLS